MSRPKSEQPTYSLTQRGLTWYIRWWEDGAARRLSCRTQDKAEARRFLAEFKAGLAADPVPQAPTIGAILDGYQTHRERKPHSATLKYDCAALKRHLGDLPADLLGAEQVEAYQIARRKEGAGGAAAKHRTATRPLSDGTLIRELGTLRTAMAWAVGKKWISAAPVIERPEAPPSRDRWLTHDELDRLLDAAVAPHVRLFIALAIYTGARTTAILQLEWDRIDFAAGTVDMGRGRGRKRRAKVPMTVGLRRELMRAQEAATTPFVIEHGGHPVASVKTGFRAAARRAKLPGVTAHVLRHTAATWMVQSGVPFAMVAAFLGNSIQMVERVYGHHSPDWLRQAAEALSRPTGPGNRIVDEAVSA